MRCFVILQVILKQAKTRFLYFVRMMLKILLPYITKPLMINGCGNETIDKELLPALIKVLDRECTIAFATENTYKEITPSVIKGKHKLVLRTPIDINLCKELNILTSDFWRCASCNQL